MANSTDDDRLRRVAKGKRPQYFEDPATDKLLTMVLVLSQELSVALDRIDTIEQMLDANQLIALKSMTDYVPPKDVFDRRERERALMLERLFRETEAEHQAATDKLAEDDANDAAR